MFRARAAGALTGYNLGQGVVKRTPFVIIILVLPFLLLASCSTVKPAGEAVSAERHFLKGVSSYQGGNFLEAEEALKKVLDDYPLSQYAIDAQIMLADLFYSTQRYEDAAAYYTTFVTYHPSHARAPYALFQKGMSHFKEVLGPDRDQTFTKKALFAFNDLVEAYPGSAYAEKAKELSVFLRKRLAEREFYVGKFYFENKNFKGALWRFGEILKAYPDTGLTDKTLYYIAESYVLLGEVELAKDTFSTLLSEFPGSPFADTAKEAQDSLSGG